MAILIPDLATAATQSCDVQVTPAGDGQWALYRDAGRTPAFQLHTGDGAEVGTLPFDENGIRWRIVVNNPGPVIQFPMLNLVTGVRYAKIVICDGGG